MNGVRPALCGSGEIVVGRIDHGGDELGAFDLVVSDPDADGRRDSVFKSHGNEGGGFDAGGEIDGVEVKGGLHDFGVVVWPVGIADGAAVVGAVGIAAGGDFDHDTGDFRVESGDAEALLAAHAGAHDNEGFAVPVGAGGEVIDGAVVGE